MTDRGRIRQMMGDERKRKNRLAKRIAELIKEYEQGRAGASCWAEVMRVADSK